MKILHLISGGDVGGAKTHVLSLLQGLSKTQQVRLVCFTEGEFAEDARKLGIDIQVLQVSVPKSIRLLSALCKSEGYQIIHCHGAKANLIGSILRRMVKIPTVTTVHSDYRLDYLGRPLDRLTYGTINTIALRLFDYHIGVSDAMANLLISRGFDPQTMYAIYNGVDFTPVEPALSREEYFSKIGLSFDRETVVFGIAARLSAVKDVGTLIRGFGRAAKTRSNIRLVIAGDGEQMGMLQKLAESTCPAGSVLFAGWQTDMNSFFSAIDVNTLTSLSETFPYAITEGARMHCATICSNVGGIPYLVEHGVTGLLFPAQDDEKLGELIGRMADSKQLRTQLGENLYEKASTDFSVDATVNKQIEIYASILRRNARPRHERRGVAICGAYGKGNAGDDAILKAILRQLKHIDPDMPIYVFSHNPAETKLKYRVGAVHAFHPLALLSVLLRTKLYINGGGSLIQDQTSSRSLHYYLSSIRLAKWTGNKVLMYGCGIGPVNRKQNRKAAARVIDRYVDAITLREDLSAAELSAMGVTKPRVHVTADPALMLEPAGDGAVEGYMLEKGLDPKGSYCLMVLRPWKDFDAKESVFVQTAAYIRSLGLEPVFFALEPDRDLAPCRSVMQKLEHPACILTAPADEALMIGLMKRMRLVISMRLHTLIFASSVSAPLVAVSYDPKVTGFMRYIGQKHCIAFEDVTAESLCRLVDAALSDRAEYSVEHLRALTAQNETIAKALLEESK